MASKNLTLTLLGILSTATVTSAQARSEHRTPDGLADNGVFVLGNDPDVNTVLAYQLIRGELELTGTFATGGKGGAGGNQGGLAYDARQKVLLAVNSGSDTVTAFRVKPGFLDLNQVVPAHGSAPVSVATCTRPGSDTGLAYVLNATSRNVAGYAVGADGGLTFLAGSEQAVSASDSGTAQILFDKKCTTVVVVERNPDSFSLFSLDEHGVAAPAVNVASLSAGQLGSAITRNNQLFVSETATSAASSFQLDGETTNITPISQTVANGQAGSCWAVATERQFSCEGRHAECTVGYVMNAGTSNITSYTIDPSGRLKLREVIAQDTFGGAFDGALANKDRNLIVQSRPSNDSRALNVYRILRDGSLEFVQLVEGLPATTNSVAAAN